MTNTDVTNGDLFVLQETVGQIRLLNTKGQGLATESFRGEISKIWVGKEKKKSDKLTDNKDIARNKENI